MPSLAKTRSKRVSWFAAVAAALFAIACQAEGPDPSLSPDGVPLRLVLALDGIPYSLFTEMQARGFFRAFRPAARMVAPFPSLSDVSFAAIGGSGPPESYQVMHFDPAKNRSVGNTLFALSSRAHPNLPADSSDHSSWHRIVGYLAPYHVALGDMRRIGREILKSRKATFVAYLEQTDSIVHVEGRAGAIRFLRRLDHFLADLQSEIRLRTGRELMVDIVSDHGSTLAKSHNVRLTRQLRSCGFRRRRHIRNADEVAYSTAGIIGSVAVTAMPESVDAVSRCLVRTDGVDLVAFDRGQRVVVLSAAGGEAEVWPTPGSAVETYTYRNLHGDPLGLLGNADEATKAFDEATLFHASLDAKYPDSLHRLWRAFHGEVREPSPILLSLRDGRDASNRVVRAFALLRGRAGTHGSLTLRASLGIITSNWRDVTDVDSWHAHDTLFGPVTMAAARHRRSNWISAAGRPVAAQVAHSAARDH